MPKKRFTLPFVLPIVAFALTILIGTLLLWSEQSAANGPVAFIDALFIATSAVCVTGLASVDPSQTFTRFGHSVMLGLIQLGGLGITTYSTLIFYMWRKRISLTDKLAVGQALLNDSSFHLGRFLTRIVIGIVVLEACGAAFLYCMEPERIGLFHAVFLAVSAFCNAGFALWPDNLIQWQQSIGVPSVIMTLIVLGGLGFVVLDECLLVFKKRFFQKWETSELQQLEMAHTRSGQVHQPPKLSSRTKIVLTTTAFLIITGALCITLPEYFGNDEDPSRIASLFWTSLFQSVTSRTAGFCTANIGLMTDVALLVMIILMFIGASPGSCGGGIKTTTFRVLIAFIKAQLKGRSEVVVDGRAMDTGTLNKMFLLIIFSLLTIIIATFILVYTEGGALPHGKTKFQALDILFEVVSAFATVGLTTGVTTELSTAGKGIVCLLMFIGRLGPICLITTLQHYQTEPKYRLPVAGLPIG